MGNPSARVRDELWERAIKAIKADGAVLQLWTSSNPQGFSYRQLGYRGRQLVDFEGLALVKIVGERGSAGQNRDPTDG